MRYLAVTLLFRLLLPSATVDRLAITVGNTVITDLQIDEDLRVAALLNGQAIKRDLDSRRAAADRLVEQLLIQHEIDLSRYPSPSEEEVSTLYSRLIDTLGGEERFKHLLIEYSVAGQTLRMHLTAQLATLRFIEFRFRPDISVSDIDIEAAYKRQVASLKASNPNGEAPPLNASAKAKLSEVLLQERTDAALNTWLAESRKQVNIVYIDSSLQ